MRDTPHSSHGPPPPSPRSVASERASSPSNSSGETRPAFQGRRRDQKGMGAALLKGRPETCGQACPGPFVLRFAGYLPCEPRNELIGVARCPPSGLGRGVTFPPRPLPSGLPTCALAEDLVRIL